jgi:hypothetical protein
VLSAMAKASGISLDTFFESMLQNALQGRSIVKPTSFSRDRGETDCSIGTMVEPVR